MRYRISNMILLVLLSVLNCSFASFDEVDTGRLNILDEQDCEALIREAWQTTYHHQPVDGKGLRLVMNTKVQASMSGVEPIDVTQELVTDGSRKYLFNQHFDVLEDPEVTVQITKPAKEILIRPTKSRDRALQSYRSNMLTVLDTMLTLSSIGKCEKLKSGTYVSLQLTDEGKQLFRVDEVLIVVKKLHGLTLASKMEVIYSKDHPRLERSVMELVSFTPHQQLDFRLKKAPLGHLYDKDGKLNNKYQGWEIIDQRPE